MLRLDEIRDRHKRTWQSELSLAYVLAVASTAGVACEFARVDIFGVDATLSTEVAGGARYRYPKLDIQVKSWTTPKERDGYLCYPLEAANYDKLLEPQQIPRVLVLVVMPQDREDWFCATDEEGTIKYCAYWKSLRDMEPSGNDSTKTIYVPKQAQFSVDALSELMLLIANGGHP